MNKETFQAALGENIRKIREDRKISKLQLSKITKKDRRTLIRLEQGLLNPSYFFLLEIASGLDVPVAELTKGLK